MTKPEILNELWNIYQIVKYSNRKQKIRTEYCMAAISDILRNNKYERYIEDQKKKGEKINDSNTKRHCKRI